MTDLEKMVQWLKTYPGWQDMPLTIDYTEPQPVNGGLFPLGMEILSRREDVLGNAWLHCRSRFTLFRSCSGQADNTENAQWLLDFQNWVLECSALHRTPRFGDVPEREHLHAEKGRLKEASQTGTGLYAVTLTAEYVKKYPAEG